VDEHLCRVLDLGEVPALVARLLALTPLLGPALGPVRHWRLGEPLCRRRHRRIAWRPAHALFEIGEAGLELSNPLVERCILRAEPGDLLFPLLVVRHADKSSAPERKSRAPCDCIRAGSAKVCELLRPGGQFTGPSSALQAREQLPTMIAVTHEMGLARHVASRVLFMAGTG